MSDKEQHPWWEEGCYCPPGKCVCGTSEDPFATKRQNSEMPSETED